MHLVSAAGRHCEALDQLPGPLVLLRGRGMPACYVHEDVLWEGYRQVPERRVKARRKLAIARQWGRRHGDTHGIADDIALAALGWKIHSHRKYGAA